MARCFTCNTGPRLDTDPSRMDPGDRVMGPAMLEFERGKRRDAPPDEGLVGRTIACANQKGGVGKTTTVVNLASYLAIAGHSVLVVDLDPQGNATSGLGVARDRSPSMYEALVEEVPVAEIAIPTAVQRLELAPSSMALAGAEVELAAMDAREHRLSEALAPVRERYDVVLVDCPPSLGLLTVNALTAADAALIPIQCEYYALEGLGQLLATVRLVQANLNPRLEIEGALLTMYDARTNLSAEVAAEVRRHLGAHLFETVIPRNVRLSEAPSHGMPIHAYAPGSRGADAYAAFAGEFGRRIGGPGAGTATA
jgi:chromosome partitioning protein